MSAFLKQLIDDLKAFSSELLAPGLQSGQTLVGNTASTVASTSALFQAIDWLTGLVPKLLQEWQQDQGGFAAEQYASPVPKQGKFSHRPMDYQQDTTRRLLPVRWQRPLARDHGHLQPLRWLLHLLELQDNSLQQVIAQMSKYIEDSLLLQNSHSDYAQHDRNTLLAMRGRLYNAQAKLNHARLLLVRGAKVRLLPTPAPPLPFPRTRNWQRLRQYARYLQQPEEGLPSFLHRVLNDTVEVADTPYLYQRWCGLHILKCLAHIGWYSKDDPLGALFLGGKVQFVKRNVKMTLWIEPRFVRHESHPSGFQCREVLETHPDYMLVTPGPHGVDAFILDPTLTADVEIRRSKGRYLDTLETQASIAGVPVSRTPLRAWSAAPIHRPHCELDDPNGYTGTIPMHPLDWTPAPLLAWLQDLDNYACAWGQLRAE
ncbi:hypothetical protein [Thioflexithrix psekupsensis]|uniref:DUF2357 domain-containing protein n=1 Tax=Thioflexithrix psekupsensis TaxID=1570016 RepID=A0A251XBH0_9GAMM|nr:hypothetical protein [Thioflexithrix psekupsensis]OUD15265.1 hypothetical protein TPSD3_01680 [Thioflexithrix psekupsensis]